MAASLGVLARAMGMGLCEAIFGLISGSRFEALRKSVVGIDSGRFTSRAHYQRQRAAEKEKSQRRLVHFGQSRCNDIVAVPSV